MFDNEMLKMNYFGNKENSYPRTNQLLQLSSLPVTSPNTLPGKIIEPSSAPLFSIPDPAYLTGTIPFAKVYRHPFFIWLNAHDLFTHITIDGATGTGKTNAIESIALHIALATALEELIIFLIDSQKGDLSALAGIVPQSIVLSDFVDDLLTPPPLDKYLSTGEKIILSKEYVERVLHHVGQVNWSNIIEFSEMNFAIEALLKKGFFINGKFPKKDDLFHALRTSRNLKGVEKTKVESIVSKLTMILSGLKKDQHHRVLNYEKLLKFKLVIVDVSMMNPYQSQAVLINLIEKIYFYKLKGKGKNNNKKAVFIIDEAQPLIAKNANTPDGNPVLGSLLKLTRSTGVGFILASQNPSQVSTLASSNAGINVSFRLHGEEAHYASRNLGLTEEQMDFMRKMRPGMGIMSWANRGIEPFPIVFPLIEKSKVNQQMIRRARMYANYVYDHPKDIDGLYFENPCMREPETVYEPESSKPNEVEKGESNVTDFQARVNKLLRIICKFPTMKLTDLYMKCGITTKQGEEVKDYLVETETATIEGVNTGVQGGQFNCLVLTQKGIIKAKSLGLSYKRLPGRGSFEHRYWQNYLKKYFEREGYYVRLEGDSGKSDRADLLIEKDDKRIAVEFEQSSKNVVENAKRNFKNNYQGMIIVVLSQRIRTEVEKVIKQQLQEYSESILLTRMKEYIL